MSNKEQQPKTGIPGPLGVKTGYNLEWNTKHAPRAKRFATKPIAPVCQRMTRVQLQMPDIMLDFQPFWVTFFA